MLQERSELLPQCNMYIMHMQSGWLIKHRRTARCFNNTDMRLRRKDVEVASRCAEMEFNLTGKEGEETIEVVSLFTYLGRTLDQ